jgi:hypothetical protein
MNDLSKLLEGKIVLVSNTYEEGSLGYIAACEVREHAKTTICSDKRYKMSNEPSGYRIIEGGKVILTRIEDFNEIESRLKLKIDVEIYIK